MAPESLMNGGFQETAVWSSEEEKKNSILIQSCIGRFTLSVHIYVPVCWQTQEEQHPSAHLHLTS